MHAHKENSSASPFHHPNSHSHSVVLIAAEDCEAQKNKEKTDIEIAVSTSDGFNGGALFSSGNKHNSDSSALRQQVCSVIILSVLIYSVFLCIYTVLYA